MYLSERLNDPQFHMPGLKLPAVPLQRDGESSTVRKFTIFRFARLPRPTKAGLRGRRSFLRFKTND